MSRRLIVVGGNGFIGQETVRRAVDDGWDVLSIDPAEPRVAGGVSAARRVAASITDRPALAAAVAEFRPDAAINLAAYGDGTSGLASGAAHHPGRAVEINIGGMVTLLTVLAEAGCRNLIWSSSSTVYGPAVRSSAGAVTEDAACAPELVYGATKVGAEQIARVLGAELGVRSVAVRLPLIYGSGRWYGGSQDGLVQFVDDLRSGADAHLDGWTDPADWMHVSDAAGALLALADTPAAQAPAYNVSGHRSSLYEMGVALVQAAAAQGRATVTATSTGAPALPLMNTGLIESHTGYRPAVTSARDGARLYIHQRRDDEHAV